ncbi:MAG TPA: hypothetical protein VMA98_11970 [Candidatus Acidoferrales bacterium]|nr:hypothetical protein [Candidatus Acidoferrales bacterium]
MSARVDRIIAALVAIALAGCGGGSSLPAPSSHAQTQAATTAQFRILIPPKSAQAVLSPKYVSSSTQSVTITLTSVNGAAYTGTVSSPAAVTTSLTPSSSNCTSGASGLTCIAPATAVAGDDIYSVATYDASNDLLSEGTATLTVVAGQANTGNLTLNGVMASVTLAFATDSHVSGSQSAGYAIVGNQPHTFTVVPLDAGGNTIVGAGTPTLTVTASSSAVAIASTATAGTYTAQVQSYSATPVQIVVTPSTGSAVDVPVTTVQEMWVANAGGNNITAYNTSSGAEITADTITVGADSPFMIQTGPNGDLWISNYASGQIEEVVPSTNVAVLSISGSNSAIDDPFGIAFDAGGDLYLSNSGAGGMEKFGASSFAGLTGAQDITPTLNSPGDASDPVQDAVDGSGNLWVADDGDATIHVFNSGLNQIASLTGSQTFLVGPTGVAFDAAGHLWVADNAAPAIDEYTATAITAIGTNIQPVVRIDGGNTGLHQPVGLAFDGAGNLWVANYQTTTSVLEYAAGSLATGGNLTPITTLETGLDEAAGVTFTP